MAPPKQLANPFYPLLLVAGIAFVITACGYAVLATHGTVDATQVETSNFLRWMDAHGFLALMIELAVLAVLTLAAMATDDFWIARRQAAANGRPEVPVGDQRNSDSPSAQDQGL